MGAGSYSKTSFTRFSATLVDGTCCGNDRESSSDLAAITQHLPERGMAFEVSNRHLRNSFQRILEIEV